jgi:cytoplasmic iron level regulating protein YaaA (DUF328/UPF0246 family)
MFILISPAKTLKTDLPATKNSSMPVFLSRSELIASALSKMKPSQLSELMGISAKLAQLNYERYKTWKTPYNMEEANNAIFSFRGEVFRSLDIDSFNDEELEYTNNHLRILSGLYGILKPKDAILPYRLEMGTKLSIGRFKNLYEFWGDQISLHIKKEMERNGESTLINLASNEYFKTIKVKKLTAKVITPVFMEQKGSNYKTISIFAKKARGMMTRFVIKNRIEEAESLKHFDEGGYFYNDKMSDNTRFVFTR